MVSYQNVSWRNIQLIFGPPTVAWRVLWNSVCLSFCQSFCLAGTFTWNCFIVFSKFWHGARNLYGILCDKAWFSWKKKICYKNWANGPKMCQKQGFLSLLKNLVSHFYWVCSVMKIYFICCVPAQIPYLGKFIVPEIWAKIFSANQIARFFNQPYLQNKSMK